ARFSKWCEPLEKYYSAAELEQIIPAALNAGFYRSHLVTIPLYMDVNLLYYRKDLIRQLPDWPDIEAKLKQSMSWKEFFQLGSRLFSAGRPFYVFSAAADEGLVLQFWQLIANQNRSILIADDISLTSKEAQTSLQLMIDVIHKYHLTPKTVFELKESQVTQYALDNNAVFFRGWPGVYKDLQNEGLFNVADIGRATFPHFEGHTHTPMLGGWHLMLSKHSNKKKEAVQFIKFITSKEMQTLLLEELYYLPIAKSVYRDSAIVTKYPELAYIKKLLDCGQYRPARPDYTQMSDILAYYLQAAMKNEKTAAQALKQSERFLKENKVLIK
ncbi:extracellular solute-binding protein, partial [candidate division KSB1 bacterium]|nr:extracellular solute-binding protein [candidate division KSB1 bacterium]